MESFIPKEETVQSAPGSELGEGQEQISEREILYRVL